MAFLLSLASRADGREMARVAFVRSSDQSFIETCLVFAAFVSASKEDCFTLGVECEGDTPYLALPAEA